MTVREVIERNIRGGVPAPTLLRALATHDWFVPAELVEGRPIPLVTTGHDGRWLSLFTDRPALASWEAKTRPVSAFLVVPGTGLFASMSPSLAGVNIDPLEKHAIHYRQEQFGVLREWAQAVEVSRVVHGTSRVADPFALLRSYEHWRFVTRPGPSGARQMAMAPDTQKRRLAAIFTAIDTLTAFVKASAKELGREAVIEVRSGKALFGALAKMPIDGIVFDCLGPVEPKAVAPSFAEIVLKGVHVETATGGR